MGKATPSTGQEDLVAGCFVFAKLKDSASAREIIRRPELPDDAPS